VSKREAREACQPCWPSAAARLSSSCRRHPSSGARCSQVVRAIAPSYKRVYPNQVRRFSRRVEPQSLPLTLLAPRSADSCCGGTRCATSILFGFASFVSPESSRPRQRSILPVPRQASLIVQLLHVFRAVKSHTILSIS